MNVYGLIGLPLTHSFSKKFFSDKFERENLQDCIFNLFPLSTINDLPELLQTHKNLKGLAVTIPYKEEVLPYLSSLEPVIQQIGAVNCIKIHNGVLTGFNTDVIGFEKSFTPHLQSHHKKALVLGTGGASKAVQYVLKKMSVPFLIVSRKTDNSPGYISYESINHELVDKYPVIINCTPVGMSPKENDKPLIPYQFLSSRNYLYDLVYKPEETLFLKEGLLAGAVVKNGFEMLVLQAEENWKIWSQY